MRGISLAVGIGGQELVLIFLFLILAYAVWRVVHNMSARKEWQDGPDKAGKREPSLPLSKRWIAISIKVTFGVFIALLCSDLYYCIGFLVSGGNPQKAISEFLGEAATSVYSQTSYTHTVTLTRIYEHNISLPINDHYWQLGSNGHAENLSLHKSTINADAYVVLQEIANRYQPEKATVQERVETLSPLEPSAVVPYTTTPVFFLLLIGICLFLFTGHELKRLLDIGTEPSQAKKWICAIVVFVLLALFLLVQHQGWGLFGIPFYLIEAVIFDVILIILSRLTKYLLITKPEDAMYFSRTHCIAVAGFLTLVLLTWAFNLLNNTSVFGLILALTGWLGQGYSYNPGDFVGFVNRILEHYGAFYRVFTILFAPWLIPQIVFWGYLALLAHYRGRYEVHLTEPMLNTVAGVITMKVLKNNKWVEEDQPQNNQPVEVEEDDLDPSLSASWQSLTTRDSTRLSPYANDTSASTGLSIVDRVKSKYTTAIQSRIIEDQAKVTEAQTKAIEAQKKAMEQKVGLIETATKGQRAQNEYELLPEERKVKEMGYDVSKSELELQKMKLEMEKKKLAQQMQAQMAGTYVEEPEEITELRAARQKDKQADMQVHMAAVEEDSIISKMQALDTWYDEKSEEIMNNKRLDVNRRRDQLALLEKEYKLRKKQLDDLIDAKLAADGDNIQI